MHKEKLARDAANKKLKDYVDMVYETVTQVKRKRLSPSHALCCLVSSRVSRCCGLLDAVPALRLPPFCLVPCHALSSCCLLVIRF